MVILNDDDTIWSCGLWHKLFIYSYSSLKMKFTIYHKNHEIKEVQMLMHCTGCLKKLGLLSGFEFSIFGGVFLGVKK